MNDFTIKLETTLIIKPFFTRIGNRYFSKGGHSFLTTMIGLPLTLVVYIYSYVQILIYTIKYFTRSNLIYSIPITNSIIFAINLYLILQVSFSNPGIYVPSKEVSNDPALSKSLIHLFITPLDVMIATIAKQELFLKYCRTCHIAKDLRVFHCSHCNVCILRHDHHCPWLSICIGNGNHKKFLILLPFTVIYLLLTFFTLICLLAYVKEIQGDNILYSEISIDEMVICSVLTALVLIVFFFVSALMCFQSYYISHNETTSENIKKLKNSINPYALGSYSLNIKEFFNDSLGYRNRIEYNQNSRKYLDRVELFSDYVKRIKNEAKPIMTEMRSSYSTETNSTSSIKSSKQLELIEEKV